MRRPLGLLLLAAAVAAGAESTASVALFAVAVGVTLLIACAGLTTALAARRLTVARTVVEREVQEDDPVRLRFDVQGIKWLPVRVEAEEESGVWVELAPASTFLEVWVRRRGAYRLLPSRLRVRDALGIFEWPLRVGLPEPLLILPKPEGQANLHPRHPAGADPEPDGLRAHIPGDPLASIHWPALARGAGLQVRRFAAAPSGLPLVVVDTAGTRDPHAVDWAARAAAGHILAFSRSGGCRVVLPGDATATTLMDLDAGWRALHRRLATLDASSGPATPTQLPPGTPAIRVRASAAPAGPAPAPPSALPLGVVPVVSETLGAAC